MEYQELSRDSKVDDMVFWKTVIGEKFYGVLIEWDSNVAIINTKDGQMPVEC